MRRNKEEDVAQLVELVKQLGFCEWAELEERLGWDDRKRFRLAIRDALIDDLILQTDPYIDFQPERYYVPGTSQQQIEQLRVTEARQRIARLVERLGGWTELPPGYSHPGLWRGIPDSAEGVAKFLATHREHLNKWRYQVGKEAL